MKRTLLVFLACAATLGLSVGLSGSPVGRAFAQPSPAGPPAATGGPVMPGPAVQGRPIERVQFRDNRKIEDDAIRVQRLS